MRRLAEGDREALTVGLGSAGEIRRMAGAVEVFRNYLIERDAARAALETANQELETKVETRSADRPGGRRRQRHPPRADSDEPDR